MADVNDNEIKFNISSFVDSLRAMTDAMKKNSKQTTESVNKINKGMESFIAELNEKFKNIKPVDESKLGGFDIKNLFRKSADEFNGMIKELRTKLYVEETKFTIQASSLYEALKSHTNKINELESQKESIKEQLKTSEVPRIDEARLKAIDAELFQKNKDKNFDEKKFYDAVVSKQTAQEASEIPTLLTQIRDGQTQSNKGILTQISERFGLGRFSTATGIFAGGAALIYEAGKYFIKALEEFHQKTSSSLTQSYDETKKLAPTIAGNLFSGISPTATVDAAASLTNYLGSADAFTNDLVTKSAKMSVFMGLSSDESAELLGSLKLASDGSEKLAADAVAYAGGLAYANKIPVGNVLKQAAKSGAQLSAMSQSMVKSFMEASVVATKMGISISDIADKTHGLLDFEGTLEKQNLVSILTGQQLNLIEVQRSRNARDMKGTLSAVKDQLDNFDLTHMTQQQLDAMSSAFGGMSEETMQKIKSTTKSSITEMTQEQAKSIYDDKTAGITNSEGWVNIVRGGVDGVESHLKWIGGILLANNLLGGKSILKWIGSKLGIGAAESVAAAGAETVVGGSAVAGAGTIAGLTGVAGVLTTAAAGVTGALGGDFAGKLANKLGAGKTGSFLSSVGGGALTGAAIGNFIPIPLIGPAIGAAVGAIGGGIESYLTNENGNIPDNGNAVANTAFGTAQSPQETNSEIYNNLSSIMAEVVSALKSMPASIALNGNVTIDGRKLGDFILDTVENSRHANRGSIATDRRVLGTVG